MVRMGGREEMKVKFLWAVGEEPVPPNAWGSGKVNKSIPAFLQKEKSPSQAVCPVLCCCYAGQLILFLNLTEPLK